MNYIVWGIVACIGILIICWALASSKEEESVVKRNQEVLNSIKSDISSLNKRFNELNTRLYDAASAQVEHERVSKSEILSLEKKLRDMEYDVFKPRNVNVHLPKGLNLVSEKPLKVIAAVRKSSASKKKVSKKKTMSKKK